MIRALPLLVIAVLLAWPAAAHGTVDADHSAAVTLRRHADGATGTLEVELSPHDVWHGDVFVSLYRGSFRERKGLRPSDEGDYRLEVRVPEAGDWGVYLRYGVAQAGFAGYGRLAVPAAGGTATTSIDLTSGFAREVPGYVQPLGFTVFGLIALVTFLGLRALLQQIRQSQAGSPATG